MIYALAIGYVLFNGIGIYCIVKAVLKAAKETEEQNAQSKTNQN